MKSVWCISAMTLVLCLLGGLQWPGLANHELGSDQLSSLEGGAVFCNRSYYKENPCPAKAGHTCTAKFKKPDKYDSSDIQDLFTKKKNICKENGCQTIYTRVVVSTPCTQV